MTREELLVYHKKRKVLLTSVGLCRYCGKNRKQENNKLCLECAHKHYEANRLRYAQAKKEIVDYLGGKCKDCGNSFPLCVYDIHHLDPNKKTISFAGKNLLRPLYKLKNELDNCILLCANCHRIRTWNKNEKF